MMVRVEDCASIADFVAPARSRLPGFAWRSLYGAAGENGGMLRNETAFQQILFRGKRLAMRPGPATVTLFDKSYSQPFGIAPVALCDSFRLGSDMALARLAAAKNIPMVLSTGASTSIESVAAIAGDRLWFQLYLSRDDAITVDLLHRAWAAGIRVLVFTVDAPAAPRRNMMIRSDFATRWGRRSKLDLALHPRWSFAMLSKGRAKLANFTPYGAMAPQSLAQVCHDGTLSWDALRRLRDLWKGKLVIKGVLDVDDAVRMIREGADGIWVSNHGGRQLESLPATISVLPGLRDALGPSAPIFIDSGIRSGEDVLKALALGANFAFSGRCFMYGAAAFGARGVSAAHDILTAEVTAALTQIGCPSLENLDRSYIYHSLLSQHKIT